MISGLPAYKPPVVEDVRCYCGARFRVFTGCEDYQARFAEKEAEQLGAVFVDARRLPFVVCVCGQALDFSPESSLLVQ
jgi:hypothetical protein